MKITAALAVACVLLIPAAARAELVRFTSGRVMSVASCRFSGDSVIMALRTGGEMTAPRALIAEVLADEVPHPTAVALELLATPQAVVAMLPVDALHGLIDRLAGVYGIDARLAHAVVQVESNYAPGAISSKGAMGLMQIMPAVARQYAIDDPFNPEKNLAAGLQYLRSLLDRFPSDLSRALAAYNAGEGAVARYGGIPPFPETQQYVRRVLALVGHP